MGNIATSIAYTSEKGGVWKTGGSTIHAVILSTLLASIQQKVLIFDMDPQGHAENLLGHPRDTHRGKTIKEVILDEVPIQEVIVPTYINTETAQFTNDPSMGPTIAGPDLVPITLNANSLDFDMKSRLAYWPERMREIIETIQNEYAYIIFDCPPGLLAPTMSVYAGVGYLAFPITPDKLGVEGFQGAIGAMQRTQKRNKDLKAAGGVFTRVHNWKTDRAIMDTVNELVRNSGLDIPILQSVIPESKDYSEAINDDQSLVILTRAQTKCAHACWYTLHELLIHTGGAALPIIEQSVLVMKQQEREAEKERKTAKQPTK